MFQRTLSDSPNFVATGRDAAMVADLISSDAYIAHRYVLGEDKSPHQYGAALQVRLKHIYEEFFVKMCKENEKQQILVNKTRKPKNVEIGSIVLVQYPRKPHVSPKQNPELIGPFRVMDIIGDKIIIKTRAGRKSYNVHRRRVRIIPQNFEVEYISWVAEDAKGLLDDETANLTDLTEEEEQLLPELPSKIPPGHISLNNSHEVDNCA